MSVKSTVYLTRAEAEEKCVELRLPASRQRLMAQARDLSKAELEAILELLNDREHGGEGFENYVIRETSP